jgi:sialate O-acetylesterase
MELTGSNKITIKDILIGDVWLCAGQSNMVHQMELHKETYAVDIAKADYPHIRQFWVPLKANLERTEEDLQTGYWKCANPEDVRQFSAVAYFIARNLYEQYGVPIGLINASVGGTPVEAWTSGKGLQTFPELTPIIKRNKDTSFINNAQRAAAAQQAFLNKRNLADKGITEATKWYDTTYTPKGWRPISIPGYWEDQGASNLDGIVWYRKEIAVPESMRGQPAKLYLGRIVDADVVYINGIPVGQTGYQYPQRRYTVPAGLLHGGKNTIVVRVINNSGKGGFVPHKPYRLYAGEEKIDLIGEWQYKVGAVFTPLKSNAGINIQNEPAALFNGMIAPLLPYSLKGMLWYQGESNAGKPQNYASLFTNFIRDWRSHFQQGSIPFLYVQLPNFMDASYLPQESNWALMREAQAAALSEPNTAMAVAIDLGEWNDIHPDNKKDVGIRLAKAAQKLVYGAPMVASGPIFQSATIKDSTITITFSDTGSGLVTANGEAPGGFAIAGKDKNFVWAAAKIDGNKVTVWSNEIPKPLYVRYAWADNPHNANLYNKEGLPAAPFRTDGNIQTKSAKANNNQ